jgi:hypothetical protein
VPNSPRRALLNVLASSGCKRKFYTGEEDQSFAALRAALSCGR